MSVVKTTSKLCHDCPHLKRDEGGRLRADEAIQGGGRFKDAPHPCHNAPTTLCRGHVWELELVETGAAKYNGDTVNNLYALTITTREGALEIRGEFTADEIRKLRYGTEEERAETLAACPVGYTEKMIGGGPLPVGRDLVTEA